MGSRIAHRLRPVVLAAWAVAFGLAAWVVAFGLAAWCGLDSAYADDEGQAASEGSSLQVGAADDDVAEEQAEAERIADMATVKNGLYNLRSCARSDYAVSVAGESAKAGAAVAPAKRQSANWSQKWLIVQDKKTGYYTVRNLRSRYFLTVSGTVRNGAVVKQMKATSSKRQQWLLVKESGSFQLQSAANPKYSLAVVASKGDLKMRLQRTRTATRQQFRLNKARLVEDGQTFFVRSAANARKSVTIRGASKSAKARAVLQARSFSKAQKFRFVASGSGFNLQNVRSCLYLGAAKSSIVQTAGTLGKPKRWSVALDLASATFSVKSASAKRFVDATSGKLALRPKAKTASGARAQRFVLVPTYGFAVFIDAGHGRNASGQGVYDPGASGCGRQEADLTKALAKLVQGHLEGTDVRAFNGTGYSVPYWRRNAKAASLGCDAVVSIHFDAGGGNSTSTMIGAGASSASRALNAAIHRKLVSSIGLRDGGTMRRGDITVVNGKLPAVLMEVCFIDNYGSMSKYLARKERVAKSIAEGIVEASRDPALQR